MHLSIICLIQDCLKLSVTLITYFVFKILYLVGSSSFVLEYHQITCRSVKVWINVAKVQVVNNLIQTIILLLYNLYV